MSDNFYVYVYLDPRKPGNYVYGEYEFEYEPFYVGKGNGDRAYVHLKGHGTNKDFLFMVQEIKTPNIIFYKKDLFENVSLALERKMVKTIGRLNKETGPLFNKNDAGGGCPGAICSNETKKKISEKLKGHYVSEETKYKIKEKRKFQIFTEETKEKMRKKHDIKEETREKMRERAKNRKFSKETREKISSAGKGRIHSEKTRQKIGESHTGIRPSKETREKMGKAHRKYSDEIILQSVSLRKQGMVFKKISEIMNIPDGTIQGWCKK